MPALELLPFSDEHVEGAADLLRERHRRHREAEPLLPEELDFRAEVAALLEHEHASGAVALRGERVVGYLVGTPRSEPIWGPNVWVELAGHAADEAESIRDLYAAASPRWVDEGRTRQYALVPASDRPLVNAWFRLSFGQQHAFGIAEVPEEAPPTTGAREAEERDIDAIVELAPELSRHQALAPVFAGGSPLTEPADLRDEVAKDIASPEVGSFVAEMEGRIVGNFEVVPVELSSSHVGLARPQGAAFLTFAAVLPQARGTGAGLALTAACFEWARAHGRPVMVTDWRVTNLLASRFWPRRGFRPTFLRLYRSIP